MSETQSTQPADRFLTRLHEFHESQQTADAAYGTHTLAEAAEADPLACEKKKEAIWNEATSFTPVRQCRHDHGTRGMRQPDRRGGDPLRMFSPGL